MSTQIPVYCAVIASPIGPLGLIEQGGRLARLEFLVTTHPLKATASPLLIEAALQLKHYFKDPKFRFELPLAVHGSDHLLRVLAEIAAIPVGQLQTYAEISGRIQSSPRAVGGACGRNPVPLFIPCHRVVAAKGLGGFNAGRNGVDWLPIKRWLLNHEHMQYG